MPRRKSVKRICWPGRRPTLSKRSFQWKSSTDRRSGSWKGRRRRCGETEKVTSMKIVEVGVAAHVAESADIMGLQRTQRTETVEYHAGLWAEHIPAHVEQS